MEKTLDINDAIAHEIVVGLADEIQQLEQERKKIITSINTKLEMIKEKCPHINTIRIYDDDFNNPKWYNECCFCKREV